jgi:hypothetical protein
MKTFKQFRESYQMSHRPMTQSGGAAPLHDLTKSFPDDIYDSKKALQYYGSGDPREKHTLKVMHSVRNNPDAEVTIYRGVPDESHSINHGDWVTLHPEIAKDYGHVISKKVPASHITSWGDSLAEFGYHPPEK